MALADFKRIADATDLPLIVFQYSLATGQGYPKDTLLKLCEEVPTIRAIKDWIGNVPHHEWAHPHAAKSTAAGERAHHAPRLAFLVAGARPQWLVVRLRQRDCRFAGTAFRAVQRNDLAEAKRLNDGIEPIARVFYADPFVDMHNRMKEALVLLGKLPRAVVRPPVAKIERAEIMRIREALIEAGLLDKNARDAA